MNRKLVIGAVAGVAAVALAYGGSTYSAWSDFGDVNNNTVGAGILRLNLGPNQGDDLKFDNVRMAPGQINMERHVYIASNDGDSTPNARLFVSLKNLTGAENGCDSNGERAADPACESGGEGQFVRDATVQWYSYKVNSPDECTQAYAPAGKVITPQFGPSFTKLAAATATTPYELTGPAMPMLKPGEGLCFAMEVSLAKSVNNASQGDSASFDLHFDLEQV
ncbi:MAG TPA: hypothetical protein VFL94_01655 [Actinomycetales bacterium]|nr:hypothetical protein [Actinomycetales bacterium]